MRHSRRAVMTERYKLYAKKNIFNSRYFIRNLQIGLLAIILVAVLIGTVVVVSSGSGEVSATDMKVSVKDALFGNSEEVKSVTEEIKSENLVEATETTNVAVTEVAREELDSTIVEVTSNLDKVVETQQEEEMPESEFDSKCIANVDETLNIRKSPSVEAEFVGSMNVGAIAIVEGTEGEWTKIKSGDVEGYVLTEYVLTGEIAEQFAKDYVTIRGTILEDGVNVRAEQSTDAEILTVMDKDDIVTVLEQSEDETGANVELVSGDAVSEEVEEEIIITIKAQAANATTTEDTVDVDTEKEIEWIAVMLEDGQTGYVAAEYIEVEELYEIAVSAEELQRRADELARQEAEEAERIAAEEAARQAAEEAASRAAEEAARQEVQQSTTEDTYQGAVTDPVEATESGECIGTFTITAYCGCKKCGTGHNKTASGTTPTEGRTIAADTSILPFGTQVVIDGIVYTVEDCGSGVNGNHIDIFFSTHAKAVAFGRKTIKVYKY